MVVDVKGITLVSRKGGVSKTTSALHLAAALKAMGKDVLLVDDDPNRPLLSWAAKGRLGIDVRSPQQLGRLDKAYDLYVWDSRAHPQKSELEELITDTDLLVLPTTTDELDLEALAAMKADMDLVGEKVAPAVVIVTRTQPNSREGERLAADLREAGFDVAEPCVRRYAAYNRARVTGTHVGEVPGGEAAWADYQALARAVLERLEKTR